MTLQELLAYSQQDGRVCPLPLPWNVLWNLLSDRRRHGASYILPAPLILAGWVCSTDEQKRERLATHITWANDHNGFDLVSNFLRGLAESEWHHEVSRSSALQKVPEPQSR
jgi:hypothetical protein